MTQQIGNKRIHVFRVESVPLIRGRTQGQIEIARSVHLVVIVDLHVVPLAVIDPRRSAATAVHGNEQGPALGRFVTDLLEEIGAYIAVVLDLVLLKVLSKRLGLSALTIGIPNHLTDRGFVMEKQSIMRVLELDLCALRVCGCEPGLQQGLEFLSLSLAGKFRLAALLSLV